MNEQIGNKINDKTYIKLTPFKGFILENFPFIEADFDAITNYQLLCKVIEYLNNVITNQNTVQKLGTDLVNAYNSLVDAVNLAIGEFEDSITTDFNTLHDYVYNYFDNLDLQEEINNKLDEMAEDGTLQDIIFNYLNSKAIFGYDNVASLKTATNLINGSYAKTLGFYNINDGGGATYKIRTKTNADVINEMDLLSLNDSTLVAELNVNNTIALKQLGATNNGDISVLLQHAINICKEHYNLIVDDFYTLTNSVTIDKPIKIEGLSSTYSNGMCGFNCVKENYITYFNFDEGAVNCIFKYLIFKGNRDGNCIKFSSRDESLANYRVWKNQFNKCNFNNFSKAIDFYAIGDVTDYDYSSEMLFIDCKFKNNVVACEYNNTQSYNTNFIATDFECDPSISGKGFILNSYGGININGGSIILHDSLIQLGKNPNLTNSSYIGIVNITNCRFETFQETIFNYTLESGKTLYQQHSLNVNNTDFYTHNSGATLINTNVRGVKANMSISLTGSYSLIVNGQSEQSASDYSVIIINTAFPERIMVNNAGQFAPWIFVNNTLKTCCVNKDNNKNFIEYDNKIYLGYNRWNMPSSFSVSVPWNYRKFVININGAFVGNTGTITIKNSDNSFTHTFTKSVSGYNTQVHEEVLLPYKENGDTYTISATNIWGNCYFE